ncbi:MAG TPA: arginase [Stellaceae bacterium]|jgi:arginase|nr:arginase [Stellaceae bacterium]
MTAIALIGAASGWGAGFRHTEDGPIALRDLGLADWLRADGIDAEWRAMIASERRWHDHAAPGTEEIFDLVARHNEALAEAVADTLRAGNFPLVLGGDHAGAMGTWGGVARGLKGKLFGLIWLDAHLDAHTVATTPSMNPHGMPAAALLGQGDARFLAICGGVLRPEHLCYIGVRSYEPAETALLRRLGVRIIDMAEVKMRGMDSCLAEAREIATRGTAGFGITIDLDGFDPEDAPGIGLKCDDGLRAAPTIAALHGLADHPGLKALEIVEYIPEFDRDLRTAHLVRDLVVALKGKITAVKAA